MALSLARVRPMTHPDPQFHTDDDYCPDVPTRASSDYHKAKAEQERAEAIAKVPGLRTPTRIDARPLMATLLAALDERVACAEYVDEGVERFGVQTVVRALAAVLAANNIDIAGRTLDELAQGEERL